MNALEKGVSIDVAKGLLYNSHSNNSLNLAINGITYFSKRGPEFYRANMTEISKKTEKALQKLEKDNAKWEEMYTKNQLAQ